MSSELEPHILIIDDHEDSREMLSTVLELNGFSAAHASDGEEALAALAGGLRPSIIVLDWRMPGMDGATFLAELQRTKAYTSIPVVVVSAHAALQTSRPATHVLVKPIDPDELIDLIRTLMPSSRAPGGAAS